MICTSSLFHFSVLFVEWTWQIDVQQVDLATFMGLITGAGIPKSSLGLVPIDWLDTFWSDQIEQIRALARMLRHYALLSGCIARWSETEWDELPTMNMECSSKFIKRDESEFFRVD